MYHRRPTQPPSHIYGGVRRAPRRRPVERGTDSELSSIPSTRDTSPGAGASGSHHHTDSYIGKALFDFKPQDAVEVELHAGDLVHIFPGITCAQGWCVVTNRGATGLVPLSYVTRVDEDGGKGSGGRGSSGRGSSSRRHGPLLLYARDKPREELEKMTVDELQRELDTLAAQLEKDVATLKLKYAKRKQHLESVVRGKASYAAQGGQ